jgi:precorrin-6B methylase 2
MKFLLKIIPRKLITAIRFISIFNHGFGHSRREGGLCLNKKGLPVPWITYPCFEFLSRLDFRNANIFEFGSGSSTLWWSKRAKSVNSIEREEDWYQFIKSQCPSNVTIELCKNEGKYAECILTKNINFDVIIIDGAVRYPCVETALKKIKDNGIIILDNSEWYPNACKLLASKGFVQIDFCGFAPINAFTSCTSLFIKNLAALSILRPESEWLPVGGKFVKAHDDTTIDKIKKETLLLVD